jgi:hypothetical protein
MLMERFIRETSIREESQREECIRMLMGIATRENGKTMYLMDRACSPIKQAKHLEGPGLMDNQMASFKSHSELEKVTGEDLLEVPDKAREFYVLLTELSSKVYGIMMLQMVWPRLVTPTEPNMKAPSETTVSMEMEL